jgi:hypothetical protein
VSQRVRDAGMKKMMEDTAPEGMKAMSDMPSTASA